MTRRNITSDEARYYDQMAEMIKDSPRSLLASSPSLFSNRITVQSLITRYELYKMVLDIPGDIVECVSLSRQFIFVVSAFVSHT